jgi:hypothetical protein
MDIWTSRGSDDFCTCFYGSGLCLVEGQVKVMLDILIHLLEECETYINMVLHCGNRCSYAHSYLFSSCIRAERGDLKILVLGIFGVLVMSQIEPSQRDIHPSRIVFRTVFSLIHFENHPIFSSSLAKILLIPVSSIPYKQLRKRKQLTRS